MNPQDQEAAPAEISTAGAGRTKKKRRGFFASDMDQFEQAGKLGLVPAAAYLALMAGTESIRDVIAFPKTTSAQCLMTGAPSPIPDVQLAEVHVQVRLKASEQ